MSLPADLIDQPRSLAKSGRRRPKQADLRRAVSTAYYAVFHALSELAADRVLRGVSHDRLGLTSLVQRSISHSNVKKAAAWLSCAPGQIKGVVRQARGNGAVNARLQWVCTRIVTLQELRHQADYDFSNQSPRWNRADALRLIDEAKRCIEELRDLEPSPDLTLLLVGCVLGERLLRNSE